MNVSINGSSAQIERVATVLDAIGLAGHTGKAFGIAVALNGEVVPRAVWGTTALSEGDRIEVLVAAQGG